MIESKWFRCSLCFPCNMKRFLTYRFVRFPVAAVLTFAILTKAYQVAVEPSDGVPWLAIGHVLFESGLTLLLLSGVWPRWIKWVTVAVFVVFCGVAVDLALKSAASCGCFGSIRVDPKITAALDTIIVLALLFSSVENRRERPSRKKIALIASGMFLTSFLLIPMSLHPPVQRFDHGTVIAETEADVPDIIAETHPPPSGLVPPEFRLGYVEPKSVHRFALEIVNPTGENWPLDAVETECECLTVVEKPECCLPGKSSLTFEFKTPDIVGAYSKTITVVSGEQQWTTRFHARIDTPLAAEPEILVFASGDTEQTFTIRNDGKVPVRLLYATSSSNFCVVKVGLEPVVPGGSLELVASLSGALPTGEQTIMIHTNFPRQKTLRIQVRGEKIPKITTF